MPKKIARSGLRVAVVALIGVGTWRYVGSRPLSGTLERQLVVDGVTRTYLLHATGAAKPGRALVLVLHGWGGRGASIERRTRGAFDERADRDGAVVAYPEALGEPRRWNDGWVRPAPGASLPDDVTFVARLVDALVAELGVDRRRVFATGHSNGAAMVYRLACERPDLVAAIAPISGGMPPDVARACADGAPVSLLGMHGTADRVVPFDPSITAGVAAWARRDGCATVPLLSALPDLDPGDGTRTRVQTFPSCAAGAEVAFYTIEGGGHTWPGGAWTVRRGNTARDFDAGVVIWNFFARHARR
ncbi:MAG TPA: PHB depolymerase family esterase [Polyangia bacterium]